jgi:hypothetical protein
MPGVEIRFVGNPALYRLSYRGFSWVTFCNMLVSLWREVVSLTSSPPPPQAGVLSLVGCPRLIIQYIHNFARNPTTGQKREALKMEINTEVRF